ncbi:MAG: hypothetical protein WBL35_04805 [Ornithinibacter sp.]
MTVTNASAVPADVALNLEAGKRVDISSVRSPAEGSAHGFSWTGTRTPALPPTVTSITPGASPATEGVTIAHGATGAPSSDGLSQGAENRDGTSGATYVGVSSSDWTVNTSPSQPGGSMSVTYDASSARSGTYVLAPQATSTVVEGTISVPQTLTVK